MKKNILLMILVVSVISIGCTTMGNVVYSKSEGGSKAKVYQVKVDQAWEIAKAVCHQLGAESIEENPSEGYLIMRTKPNLISYGTVMQASIEPIDENNMRVTVVTRRSDSPTTFMVSFTESFHKRFAEMLDVVKQGKPISSQ